MIRSKKAGITILAATATMFSFVLFAFTGKADATQNGKVVAPVTYYYELRTNAAAQMSNPENWSQTPTDDCGGATYVCSIVIDDTTYPTIDAFLEDHDTRQEIEDNALSVNLKN